MRRGGAVRERSVAVAGVRLHVRERGEGRPLLLINGIGAHVDMWGPLERALTGIRVIAFDAPGTGRSMTTWAPLTLELLSEMAERLLDRLGYERVDVLGYSFGGLVAQFLARRAPERVRRLVLAATTPGWGGVPGSTWALQQMSTPLRYYWPPYYQAVIGSLMGGRARTDPEFVRRHRDVRMLNPPTPLGYLWQVMALLAGPGSLSWLSRLEAETLVVAGDDDPVMPLANALLLARHIPGARLFVARGEGHLLMVDGSSQALPVIGSFLAADVLRQAAGWQQASVVTEGMVDQAVRGECGRLANPMALLSAAARKLSGLHPPRS